VLACQNQRSPESIREFWLPFSLFLSFGQTKERKEKSYLSITNFQLMKSTVLLYGANGYTGVLIAKYAKQYNLQPILAGRNEQAIKKLADELQLPYKISDLDNAEQLKAALQNIKVVIHAAGPFAHTAKQMIDACLQTGTHYLDINGDISVFEMIKSYNAKAKEKISCSCQELVSM
jgi:short subunit dehydrogenase-like uncharacterized protein